jgi:2-phospho-L-lactate guanylyltransferase
MRLLVPFDARDPNSRLDPVLAGPGRRDLAQHMLADVLDACRAAGQEPTVIATGPVDCSAPVEVDDRPLTPAVNAVMAESDEPVAVVMADLALATGEALHRFLGADGDVVLAPGRGGGTNALLSRHPAFRVDYHGVSIRDHRRQARGCDASLRVVDSFRLAVDVDEPADLLEILLHGEGRTPGWLREAGFGVETAEGEAVLTTPSA